MAVHVRSMVGLIPLFTCLVVEIDMIQKLPGFRKTLARFLQSRQDLAKQVYHTGLYKIINVVKKVAMPSILSLDLLDGEK